MNHIAVLKRYVDKPLSELQTLAANPSYTVTSEGNLVKTQIHTESVLIRGKYITLHKLIVSTNDTGTYKNVGWVHTSDMPFCSVCLQDFYFFSSKYHCHACGNIVCGNCCIEDVKVKELPRCGGVQVGKCCFWGQEDVERVPLVPINVAKAAFTIQVNELISGREQWSLDAVPLLAAIKDEHHSSLTFGALLRSFSYDATADAQTPCKSTSRKAFKPRPVRATDDTWNSLLCEEYTSNKQKHKSGPRSTGAVSVVAKGQRKRDSAEIANWFKRLSGSVPDTRSVDHVAQEGLTLDCPSADTFDLGSPGRETQHYSHKAFQFDEAAANKSVGKIAGYNTASLKGQKLLTDDALVHRQELCLSTREAAALKAASLDNNEILVGWQVALMADDRTLLGLGVITGVQRKTALFLHSYYRISTHTGTDCWLRLKRSEKHSGAVEFQPLRKVLFRMTVTSLDA